MSKSCSLEICVDSLDAAMAAERGGEEKLGLFAERFFESRNNPIDWTIPKRRNPRILRSRVGGIENRFIPVESFLLTAVRLRQ